MKKLILTSVFAACIGTAAAAQTPTPPQAPATGSQKPEAAAQSNGCSDGVRVP